MFASLRKARRERNVGFFGAFALHAAKSVEAAKLFQELLTRLSDVEHRAMLSTKIKEAETAGDRITHQTVKQLRETWITPLDRLDIHNLITRMDDILDFIEAAADRVVLFDVREALPEALELSEIIVRACETVAKAIGLLHEMKNAPAILELCVEIKRLENAADSVYRRALARLFKTEGELNPLYVMKWRDILDSLEDATDRCEDVANIVEGVVLEYS